jgi:hypothetical protein
MKIANALSKQLFGAKYESVRKSLLAAVIMFFAVYAVELRLEIAPFILYLTSTFFTAGIMWQMFSGSRHKEAMQGLFMLPFENRSFVYSYVAVLGVHTLITKTLPIWALFFAASKWSGFEIAVALLCGCMACAVTSVAYLMCGRKNVALPVLWAAGILFVIVLVRQTKAVLAVTLVSLIAAALYLYFANAYEFYHSAAAKKSVRHTGRTGSVFTYLTRYLMANKNYLVNTVGLCVIACFLPLLFGEFQGLNIFPLGPAILCLNTPICTLLSCDPDLEQAIRVLPGQAGRFCRRYCLFIFSVNGIIACIYLCSWQFINGGIGLADLGIVALFALQSAILSVVLEWKYPLRHWKTESDLWHHPRKYLVPLVMMSLAVFVATWTVILWIWTVVLLLECCILLYVTRG